MGIISDIINWSQILSNRYYMYFEFQIISSVLCILIFQISNLGDIQPFILNLQLKNLVESKHAEGQICQISWSQLWFWWSWARIFSEQAVLPYKVLYIANHSKSSKTFNSDKKTAINEVLTTIIQTFFNIHNERAWPKHFK